MATETRTGGRRPVPSGSQAGPARRARCPSTLWPVCGRVCVVCAHMCVRACVRARARACVTVRGEGGRQAPRLAPSRLQLASVSLPQTEKHDSPDRPGYSGDEADRPEPPDLLSESLTPAPGPPDPE
jgi:hypothetical protein